jgi:PEP-CTERM motif-containing protein
VTPEPGVLGLTLIGLTMLGFAVIRKRNVQGLTQAA